MDVFEIIWYIALFIGFIIIDKYYKLLDFRRTLREFKVTYIFLIVYAFMFILANIRPDLYQILLLNDSDILLNGEYYRLLTFGFAGNATNFFKFLLYGFFLFTIGIHIEAEFNKVYYLVVFFILELLGGLISTFFSLGFSGGIEIIIFGIAGMLTAKTFRFFVIGFQSAVDIIFRIIFRGFFSAVPELVFLLVALIMFFIGLFFGLLPRIRFTVYNWSKSKIFYWKKSKRSLKDINKAVRKKKESNWITFEELDKHINQAEILNYYPVSVEVKHDISIHGNLFKIKFKPKEEDGFYPWVASLGKNEFQKLHEFLLSRGFTLIFHQESFVYGGHQGIWMIRGDLTAEQREALTKVEGVRKKLTFGSENKVREATDIRI